MPGFSILAMCYYYTETESTSGSLTSSNIIHVRFDPNKQQRGLVLCDNQSQSPGPLEEPFVLCGSPLEQKQLGLCMKRSCQTTVWGITLWHFKNRFPGSTLSDVELTGLGCSRPAVDSCVLGSLRSDAGSQGTERWEEQWKPAILSLNRAHWQPVKVADKKLAEVAWTLGLNLLAGSHLSTATPGSLQNDLHSTPQEVNVTG